MNKQLLVINAGSSSIKFACYKVYLSAEQTLDIKGQIERIGSQPNFTVHRTNGEVLVDKCITNDDAQNHQQAIHLVHSWLVEYLAGATLLAIGHRVVHGGQQYTKPVIIDDHVLADLEALIPLAPLHQSHNLSAIRAYREILPDLPQVACFDTAFHSTQPEVAQRFALPQRFFDDGIRRYGFHGLSYEYIASILPRLDPILANTRIVVAHLGNGASLCALQNGRSIASTMGFSPLDGLVMGTRCGSIDPGVLLYLMGHYGMAAESLAQLLYHESGLLGVSGIASDMRTLLASEDAQAQMAISLFMYRLARELGSLVAALGGLDALIFTAGIGEHSATIRKQVCQQCAWLGLVLDDAANDAGNVIISSSHSKVSVWTVPTDENLMIAQHTIRLVDDATNSAGNEICA